MLLGVWPSTGSSQFTKGCALKNKLDPPCPRSCQLSIALQLVMDFIHFLYLHVDYV